MHDPRDPTLSPREPATPPPLPPRIELRIEPAPTSHLAGGALSRPMSQRRLALCFGFGGFLAGVVFWHTVGFWQLMHTTIYSGTPVDVAENAAPGNFADAIDRVISSSSPQGKPAGITTGAVAPTAGKSPARFDGAETNAPTAQPTNCASFTRDPATGEVRSRPCSEKERALPHNPGGERENFAQQTSAGSDSRWPSYMSTGATD